MDDNSIRRIQPHNTEAEQSVIGAMLMDTNVIRDLYDVLTKDDFYNPQFGILFETMVELYKEGKPADVVTINDRLRNRFRRRYAARHFCLRYSGDLLLL